MLAAALRHAAPLLLTGCALDEVWRMHEHLSASRRGRGRAASPSEEGTLSPSSGASRCDELRRGLRDEVAKLQARPLRPPHLGARARVAAVRGGAAARAHRGPLARRGDRAPVPARRRRRRRNSDGAASAAAAPRGLSLPERTGGGSGVCPTPVPCLVKKCVLSRERHYSPPPVTRPPWRGAPLPPPALGIRVLHEATVGPACALGVPCPVGKPSS